MQEGKTFEMARERLKQLILINGLKWDEGFNPDSFVPKWIFDLREVVLTPEGARLASILLYDKIKDVDFDMIGGTSIAAEPLVASLVLHFYSKGKNVPGLIVRKQPNNFGLRKKVEGPIQDGKKVVIIDDAINAGNSMLDAIESLNKEGCSIVKIVTLLDFCKSGHSRLKEADYPIDSVFTLEDFGLEKRVLHRYGHKPKLTKIEAHKNENEMLKEINKSVCGEAADFKLHDGFIFAALKDGSLYCLHNADYSVKWKLELGDSISAPVFIDDGTAVVSASSGLGNSMVFFISIEEGKVSKYLRLKGDIRSEPVLYKDSYFICAGGNLYKLSKDNYEISLIFEANSALSAPIIDEATETSYISSSNGDIYAFDLKGKQIWKNHYGKIKAKPLIKDDKLVFVSEANVIFCINKGNGNLVWFSELKNSAFDIKLMPDSIAVGCFRGYLFFLSISNGKILSSFKLSNHSIKEIKNHSGKLSVKLEDGNYYIAEI
ncbi:PQQ-binding-like beta-propeller repeat protein [Candidatus Woesearchaeota archaeon]|nr:PQQ-binding-like beta-propeller repeat protein [Candidatus Woesearchaeota archaeon]